MMIDRPIEVEKVRIDSILFLSNDQLSIDVLRTDLIHPIISGNKWYKLKDYLNEAIQLRKKIILTFGGAYSNHIVATAAATRQNGFKSIGVIRGEKPAKPSHTLLTAMDFGMQLYFISRTSYKKKTIPDDVFNDFSEKDIYTIPDGGYGMKGVEGAKDILDQVDVSAYTHFIAAVGTGTTLAGLIAASTAGQKIIGISALKNNYSLQQDVETLVKTQNHHRFAILHDDHFGGYAKYTSELLDFMNNWYRKTGIPSDFVYTGKLFFAVHDLTQKKFFPKGSKVLVIHSGGLQGNQSLPKRTLIF